MHKLHVLNKEKTDDLAGLVKDEIEYFGILKNLNFALFFAFHFHIISQTDLSMDFKNYCRVQPPRKFIFENSALEMPEYKNLVKEDYFFYHK